MEAQAQLARMFSSEDAVLEAEEEAAALEAEEAAAAEQEYYNQQVYLLRCRILGFFLLFALLLLSLSWSVCVP